MKLEQIEKTPATKSESGTNREPVQLKAQAQLLFKSAASKNKFNQLY